MTITDNTKRTLESTILSVSELTTTIKSLLENRIGRVSVRGEISNGKLQSSGHYYFDLKDAQAKIPAVLFRASTQLTKIPKEGDLVIVEGALSVYPPHGKYQIIAQTLQLAGVGDLLLKYEELKKKLQARGWFELSLKKPLPKFPKRIGVVTSPTGAVICDILHVLRRRFSGFHLVLNPVRVQGLEAAVEIAEAIKQFNQFKLADVLIVGRGGGSLEDLWPFNEEIVAQAIHESEIPIISAVGHETDVTLADFVADVRAPTPSAAAELVISEKKRHIESLVKLEKNFRHNLLSQVKAHRMRLKHFLHHPLLIDPYKLVAIPLQRVDDINTQITRHMQHHLLHLRALIEAKHKAIQAIKPNTQLQYFKKRLVAYERGLYQLQKNHLNLRRERLTRIAHALEGLNPKTVLKRGYCILFSQNKGSVIMSSQELTPKMRARALLQDGEVELEVIK